MDTLKNFWLGDEITQEFANKKTSEYITNFLFNLDRSFKVLDIGCGAGRYLKYLKKIGMKSIVGIDNSQSMLNYISDKDIKTILADMKAIPLFEKFDVILSIGVLHNVNSVDEFCLSLKEINRLLATKGIGVCSIFTKDIISEDLTDGGNCIYYINKTVPMLLLSKDEIKYYFKRAGLHMTEIIDEHVTQVSENGRRNVFTFLFKTV